MVTPPVVIPEPTPALPEPEVQVQPETQGWEDPATVQAPTWDDEPTTTVTTVEETVPETQPEEIVSEPEPTQPAVTEPEPEPEPDPGREWLLESGPEKERDRSLSIS